MTKRQRAAGLLGLFLTAALAGWFINNIWADIILPLVLAGLLVLGIHTPKEELISVLFPRASDQLRRLMAMGTGFALAVSAVVFIISLLENWLSPDTSFDLFLLLLFLLCWSLLGCLPFLFNAITSALTKGHSSCNRALCILVGLMMPVVLVAGSALFLRAGSDLSLPLKLLVMQNHYEDIIAEVRRRPKDDEEALYKEHSTRFHIDYGPPIRVAFPTTFGFLGNWSGIVYDPDDEATPPDKVSKAGEERAPGRTNRLFNGEPLFCRPLWGDYYNCGT